MKPLNSRSIRPAILDLNCTCHGLKEFQNSWIRLWQHQKVSKTSETTDLGLLIDQDVLPYILNILKDPLETHPKSPPWRPPALVKSHNEPADTDNTFHLEGARSRTDPPVPSARPLLHIKAFQTGVRQPPGGRS